MLDLTPVRIAAFALALVACEDRSPAVAQIGGDPCQSSQATVAVVALAVGAGLQGATPEPSNAPATPADAAQGADQPAAAEALPPLSNFDAVVAKLDLGGPVFAYRELEGDFASLAALLGEIVSAVPVEELDDEVAQAIRRLDLRALFRDLGLTRIAAAGISSKQVGDRYLNKLYIHTPTGRAGIIRLMGRNAAPFRSRTIAPADCDLLIEREVNLSEAYRLGRDLVKRMREPQARRSWAQIMGQGAADLGVTFGDVFQKLDTRTIVIGRLHDETIDLPNPNGPIPLPKFDFYVSLDGLGWLFDRLVKVLPPELAESIEKGDGYEELALPPHPLMEGVLRRDLETGRMVFATSIAFLDECQDGGGGLFDTEQFKSATAGLPEEGNGLVYISEDFTGKIRQLCIDAGTVGGLPQDLLKKGIGIAGRLLPVLDSHYASVSANSPVGMLKVTNSPSSWKGSLVALPVTFAGSAAAAVAAWSLDVADRGAQVRAQADMRALEVALDLYRVQTGQYPTEEQGLNALVEKPDGVRGWEPTLDEELLDPWGNTYEYRLGVGEDEPELFSAGPDQIPGTIDDLTLE